MSVLEIEQAIEKLPANEVGKLMAWFEDHYHKVWDAQIATDLDAVALNDLLREVDDEIEAGLAKPL